jgi:hypothetical protein
MAKEDVTHGDVVRPITSGWRVTTVQPKKNPSK